VSREVITQRVSAAIFKTMGTTYWGHELDLARSQGVIDRMTIQLTVCYLYVISYCVLLEPSLYPQPFSRYLHRNISGS